MLQNKIYIVTEDWQLDGEGGNTIHPFSSYERAKSFYDKCIELEQKEYYAHDYIACNDVEYCSSEEDFEDDDKNYVIETTDDSERKIHIWSFYEKGNYIECHSNYALKEYELDRE